MAVPSKNFTIIADSAIDVDSPITEDLMEDFRDNDIYLEEWLGKDYTAAQNHDHDGVNSKLVDIVSTINVYSEQLTSTINAADWSLDTGSLGFTPIAMTINWALDRGSDIYCGWGMGAGTSSQNGMSLRGSATTLENIAIDSDDIIGFRTNSGGDIVLTSFTESAKITAWSESGVTIETQTGAWDTTPYTIYANLQIWGA
jgi:hypothetical protein